MIRFESVTFTYADADGPAGPVEPVGPVLRDVDLEIPDGELVLVIGRTGAGKSTLLRAINGLVPHFTGGVLAGRVTVDGRDTRTNPPRELADVVGYVGQDPLAGFVTDTVEEELAYAMESLGFDPAVMRRRVEDILDSLGLTDLRLRPLTTLSSGQQQRVAIGSVLTAGARVLVLDEPTSALDPPAAEDVLATLTRLVHDLGITVVLAEHRLERVVQYADRILQVSGDGRVHDATPAAAMEAAQVAPPVVELGRLVSWRPLPLSIRDARRAATALRQQLAVLPPPRAHAVAVGESVVSVRGLVARYDDILALRGIDLDLGAGEIVALMGRNGAGKSTLLAHLVGLLRPAAGRVQVAGHDPVSRSPAELVRDVGLVPQEPADLFYADTVDAECSQDGPGSLARAVLDRLAPGISGGTHPRDLSEGQRLALALALVVAADPPVLLLDEPTRGLDYPGKGRLVDVLRALSAGGTAIILATHDVELAAEVSHRTVVLADGEVVADGATADVVTASPAFAPQVAKILAPLPWLTVAQVRASLATSGG
ncbi:MAG: energy-coupling factor transport system ATP-binding protein [Actinomycetota bacterium]|nr:energy-coupling factor transport system ATP-binding protein [Actinomycetota bacterium]